MNPNHDHTPHDLRPVADMLDRLGKDDASAPAGLENRVFEGSREHLSKLRLVGAPAVVVRTSWRITALRAAAAVAMVGGAALIYVNTRTTPTPAPVPVASGPSTLGDAADEWTTLALLTEDPISSEIIQISADAAKISRSIGTTTINEDSM